jgi:DNA-binding Xre family transcriptional regulator
MGASKQNSGLTSGSKLPKLAPDARARVRTAVIHACEALVEDMRGAGNQFIKPRVPVKAGPSKLVELKIVMNAFQRGLRDAKIKACRVLFEAVAVEYLSIDTDLEAYSERLMKVVVPFVLRELAIRYDDRLIVATILSSVTYWETRRAVGPTAAEQYPTTSVLETAKDVIDRMRREKGWTIEDLAGHAGVDIKQIYKIKNSKAVTTTTIGRIAAALKCPPSVLIDTTLKSQS